MTKYRISRKQKKREKSNLIELTNIDMMFEGRQLTKKQKKSLVFERWIMAGIQYHTYNFKK